MMFVGTGEKVDDPPEDREDGGLPATLFFREVLARPAHLAVDTVFDQGGGVRNPQSFDLREHRRQQDPAPAFSACIRKAFSRDTIRIGGSTNPMSHRVYLPGYS